MCWEKDVTLILRTMELSAPSYLRLNNMLNKDHTAASPITDKIVKYQLKLYDHTHTNKEKQTDRHRERILVWKCKAGIETFLYPSSRWWHQTAMFPSDDCRESPWNWHGSSKVLLWCWPVTLLAYATLALVNGEQIFEEVSCEAVAQTELQVLQIIWLPESPSSFVGQRRWWDPSPSVVVKVKETMHERAGWIQQLLESVLSSLFSCAFQFCDVTHWPADVT